MNANLQRRGCLLALALVTASAGAFAQDEGPLPPAEVLVADLACNSCHASTRSAPGVPPPAPGWREIRVRWRDVPDAEARIAELIVNGSAERHWTGSALFESMLPQARWVKPAEARTLARWVLRKDKP